MDRVHAWENVMTQRDRHLLSLGHHGKRRGFGSRPLLLLIDMQYNACGDRDEDILTMVKRWPSGCGHDAWKAIRNQQKLLAICRAKGVPVVYTRYFPRHIQFDGFAKKLNRSVEPADSDEMKWQIVREIAPLHDEIVVDKCYPSVLFGTPLLSWLIAMRTDTVIMVGNSTSGCVRASAIDLISHNFNVAVVEDCVFDRMELSHAASLLDLWMKYCDVVFMDEIIEYVRNL